jgi:hypothetical protein
MRRWHVGSCFDKIMEMGEAGLASEIELTSILALDNIDDHWCNY